MFWQGSVDRPTNYPNQTDATQANGSPGKKTYINEMTMKEAQTLFKYRTHMTNVKFNYKNDKNNRQELWRCDSCQSAIDTQSHILWCPSYKELRNGKDINNDRDLVSYIQNVMKIREQLNILK